MILAHPARGGEGAQRIRRRIVRADTPGEELHRPPMRPRGTKARSGAVQRPRLRLLFERRDVFREEYARNIANGGIFVPTNDVFEPRQLVDVEIELRFLAESVRLEGEVVARVPEGVLPQGSRAGVAVQLMTPAPELRRRLGRIAGVAPRPTFKPSQERPADTRASERRTARATARIGSGTDPGRTVDISQAGAMIAVDTPFVPVGKRVAVTLVHPVSGEELEVPGLVVRHVRGSGGAGIAVHFDPVPERQKDVARFVEQIQSAEHARRLAGVTGAIEALGLPNLLQMLSSSADSGVLIATRELEEGRVVFEGGMLMLASLGRAGGLKALSRLLAWETGSFEFHPRRDEETPTSPIAPMYGAVLEAIQQMDELGRLDLTALPPAARPRVDETQFPACIEELEKTERAVIDLARAGKSIRDILDALPEFDAAIYAALLSLLDRGLLCLED